MNILARRLFEEKNKPHEKRVSLTALLDNAIKEGDIARVTELAQEIHDSMCNEIQIEFKDRPPKKYTPHSLAQELGTTFEKALKYVEGEQIKFDKVYEGKQVKPLNPFKTVIVPENHSKHITAIKMMADMLPGFKVLSIYKKAFKYQHLIEERV